jgi:hypothetical protein
VPRSRGEAHDLGQQARAFALHEDAEDFRHTVTNAPQARRRRHEVSLGDRSMHVQGTMTTIQALRTSVALAASVLLACATQSTSSRAPARAETWRSPSVGVTSLQGAPLISPVERLTLARCEHEWNCSAIGVPGAPFASYDSCWAEIGARVSAELDPGDCPQIDEPQVGRCVMAIDNEGCDDPARTMQRTSQCRTSVLCPK